VAVLPKADLHVHAESDARLDRILALREGRDAYDWSRWAARLRTETPPGLPRLARMASDRCRDQSAVDELDAVPENFVDRIVDVLAEGAADGAVLIEVRFGQSTLAQPDFMALFREAERRVQEQYPTLRAEAVITGLWPPRHDEDGRLLRSCISAAGKGLAGIDLIPVPYDTEADWAPVERWAAHVSDAGLGVTAHVGEFSSVNIAAALRLPGLRRVGHAVYAAMDPRLRDQIARSNVTVECALTCNVVLGAVPSFEDHPIRRFVSCGIPVALATDDPVRIGTTIGREYAVAAALGFTTQDLLVFTRNAIEAAFVSVDRRIGLLDDMRLWEDLNAR
jgi:adenosine deaminase